MTLHHSNVSMVVYTTCNTETPSATPSVRVNEKVSTSENKKGKKNTEHNINGSITQFRVSNVNSTHSAKFISFFIYYNIISGLVHWNHIPA